MTRLSRLGVEFPYFVGPMVGLSHVGLRELVRYYTPKSASVLTFTEMLSTRRLPGEKLGSCHELRIAPGDRLHFIPQILGNEEKFIAPSVAKLCEAEPFGIDINMGCPVTHTLRHNWGFRLVGQPDYAADIVRITKRYSSVPVSVKLRGDMGSEDPEEPLDAKIDRLVSFVSKLESAGADWVTIHPRPAACRHKGRANWEMVAQTSKRVSIPVVANGDIQVARDALHVVNNLGCDGAMIGRAICARPWLIWQIAAELGSSEIPADIAHRRHAPTIGEDEGHEYPRAVIRLIRILQSYSSDERYILDKTRFFCAMGSSWYQFGHDFWKMTTKAHSVSELIERVEAYADKYVNSSVERTGLH